MIIIGEKINGTRKQVAQAIQNRDADFIRQLAERQFESGASYLDINAGTLPQREPETWPGWWKTSRKLCREQSFLWTAQIRLRSEPVSKRRQGRHDQFFEWRKVPD